jgi:hypothetical protein
MDRQAISLLSVSLERIGVLEGDDAKEDALRTLGDVLAGHASPPEESEGAFEKLLEQATLLSTPWARTRAFEDACESIGCSRLPRERRALLLEKALALADTCEQAGERIDRARVAVVTLLDVRRDEGLGDRLAALAKAAAALDDSRSRSRSLSLVAIALAKWGDREKAIAELDQLEPSAARGRSLALVAAEIFAVGDRQEAAALMASTIGEIRAEPESYEQAVALRTVLSTLLETGLELEDGDGVSRALDVVDHMHDARFKKDALVGAIRALPGAGHPPERIAEIVERLGASLDRIEETYTRAPLLGELAVALATRGDVQGCERELRKVAAMARSTLEGSGRGPRRPSTPPGAAAARVKLAPAHTPPEDDLGASGVRPQPELPELADTLGDTLAALPIPRILGALADEDDPLLLHGFASRAFDLIRSIDEPRAVSAIARQCAQLFASPALPYDYRIALLDMTLALAQSISSPEACIEAVTAIANGLSLAGATERGDGLFAGMVIGIDAGLARKAHLERAVTLVKLGRTADAREQLFAASEKGDADTWPAIEELAQTCARCGFIADLIEALSRVEPSRQSEVRTQLADIIAESTYIDPDLRVIGLESVMADAEPPATDTIACLIAQVRLLERMGDPEEVLERALGRTAALPKRQTATLLEQQLLGALLERLRRES